MKKLIIVKNSVILPELGGINGPILRPEKVELSDIYQMINRRLSVYEVNPKNHSETIKLTRENANKQNFFQKQKKTNSIKTKIRPQVKTEMTSETNTESMTVEKSSPSFVADSFSQNNKKNDYDKKSNKK